jgi:hypothetical protein
MAYNESSIGGTYGGSFRVWVNSVRSYDGGQAENYENWYVQGGINRVSSTGGTIWSDGASYTVQLGLNGVAISGGFSYNYNTATGTKNAWGSGATTAYRSSAGVGFGFTSRTDVNLNNGPYLTSGWVTANDSVQTKYRFGSITSVTPTPAGALTDETTSVSVAWYKYIGIPHIWFRLDLINNADATYHIINPSNPALWSGFQTWLQTSMVNTNSTTLYIYYGDDVDSNGTVDNWNGAWTYPITIKNDTGQANPTFSNFTYVDTNSTTTAVTGNNQVLIQGKSTLEATVSTANKATANKNATMNTYGFTIGAYSQTSPWSSGSNVVKTIGTVSDVTGIQNLSVRAVDSRTNSTTVTKAVTILPYASPAFVPTLTVGYVNNFDTSGGISVTGVGATIATISPMTLSGTDKNAVNTSTGVSFDMSKGNNTSYTGSYTNVTTARTSGSANITATLATIGTNILTKMNTLTADNTVRWYIKFKIVDALETQYYETYIDIGRPIMRIGADGNVYFQEVAYQSSNSITSSSTPAPVGSASLNQYYVTALAANATIAAPSGTLINGNRLIMRIKDNGTARTLTWNSVYRAVGASIPTTTVISKTIYVGCVYNSADSKWDVISVSFEE